MSLFTFPCLLVKDIYTYREKVAVEVPDNLKVPPAEDAGTNEDGAPAAPTELKARLNLGHSVSLAVGQTIGSGLFC